MKVFQINHYAPNFEKLRKHDALALFVRHIFEGLITDEGSVLGY